VRPGPLAAPRTPYPRCRSYGARSGTVCLGSVQAVLKPLAAAVAALIAAAVPAAAPARSPERFDEVAAWSFLRRQVELGPRPAGSSASRRLASHLRSSVPQGRFQAVPGGLRNVVGTVPGRDPRRFVVVGAHYDTKDLPGYLGANDNASGVAVVRQLARSIRPRTLRPTIVFVFFDGEETPRGVPDSQILQRGLRGSKVAARAFRRAEAMVLLDLVGDPRLRLPRDVRTDAGLWRRLRDAAARVGAGRNFPSRPVAEVLDDHVPFARAGVPTLPLIDLDYRCWHRDCDDLDAVSRESLDAAGETVLELLRRL
jgi:glutaminyl-peptide cyclotransferase